MRKMKLFGLGLGLLAVVAIAQPANAACGAPFLISSIDNDAGVYSYVINQAAVDAGNGLNGSSVSEALDGYFWAVGFGNPALGVGADNGTWGALDWLYIYPNYPATILTTWAADPGIDTCIDAQGALGSRCQATFFQDLGPEGGVFALISTPDNPASGDFLMTRDGNFDLVPAEGMSILNSTRDPGTFVLTLQVSGPSVEGIAAGAYLDAAAACQGAAGGGGTDPLNGLVAGYQVKYQVVPRGSAAPSDFRVENWADGGTGVVPLGMPAQVAVDCGGADSDLYLTYQLRLDSGFGAPIVSATTTRTECGPNVADPQQRIRVAPDQPQTRQKPTTRQRNQ